VSIHGHFRVNPAGFAALSQGLASFDVWTNAVGDRHGYRIRLEGCDKEICGDFPKLYSGHSNILHLLRDVINHATMTGQMQELETDYTSIRNRKPRTIRKIYTPFIEGDQDEPA
jgi:hypothetical protein